MDNINNGYAICFNEWIFDSSIRNDLSLLLLISSLTGEKGYCYAGNKYFAEIFDLDECTVSRKIKKLEKLGHISIEYQTKGSEVINRFIRLTKISTDGLQKNQSTIDKNVKDNNTSINNTSLIKENILKENVVDVSIATDKLKSTLERHYGRTFNSSSWREEIRKMIRIDKLSLDDIIKALDWYDEHIGETYTPVIQSTKSLREKYIKIENAMLREKKEVEEWKF